MRQDILRYVQYWFFITSSIFASRKAGGYTGTIRSKIKFVFQLSLCLPNNNFHGCPSSSFGDKTFGQIASPHYALILLLCAKNSHSGKWVKSLVSVFYKLRPNTELTCKLLRWHTDLTPRLRMRKYPLYAWCLEGGKFILTDVRSWRPWVLVVWERHQRQ
jgi:hypothetical protein